MIECQIEVFLNIFTLEDNELKILLLNKGDSDVFRLPSRLLKIDESLELSASKICNKFKIKPKLLKECHTFSAVMRNKERRTIAVSFMTLVNRNELTDYEFKYALFPLNSLPITVFDHGEIIANAISCLKKELLNLNHLRIIFNDSFTMPELQHVYEEVLAEPIDRRNFRKKFLPYLKETGKKASLVNGGRPANLYKFIAKDLERNLYNVIK